MQPFPAEPAETTYAITVDARNEAAYLGHVLGPLVELGFDAEWGLFTAAEVGAPHRRERMFILAHARGYRFPDPQQQVAGLGESSAGPRNDGRPRPLPHADGVRLAGGVAGGVAAEVAAIARPVLADADGGRKLQPAVPEQAVGSRPRDGGEAVAHALRPRRPRPQDGAHERRERPSISGAHVGDAEGQRRDAARSNTREERRPPTLDDAGRWWSAEPDVGRVVDGVSTRLDARRRRARLRCLGNGVVAEQAALAFVTLAQRAGLIEEVA